MSTFIAALQHMNLHLLESPGNPKVGGVLCTFPSGRLKALHWESRTPIADALAMGKELAAAALDSCLREGRADDADRTNWASAAAGCTALVRKWNVKTFGETRGRPKDEVQLVREPQAPAPALPPGVEALGSLALACKLLEGVVAGGGGQFSSEGGHPPGAPSHREPKAESQDSGSVQNGTETPPAEDDLF